MQVVRVYASAPVFSLAAWLRLSISTGHWKNIISTRILIARTALLALRAQNSDEEALLSLPNFNYELFWFRQVSRRERDEKFRRRAREEQIFFAHRDRVDHTRECLRNLFLSFGLLLLVSPILASIGRQTRYSKSSRWAFGLTFRRTYRRKSAKTTRLREGWGRGSRTLARNFYGAMCGVGAGDTSFYLTLRWGRDAARRGTARAGPETRGDDAPRSLLLQIGRSRSSRAADRSSRCIIIAPSSDTSVLCVAACYTTAQSHATAPTFPSFNDARAP